MKTTICPVLFCMVLTGVSADPNEISVSFTGLGVFINGAFQGVAPGVCGSVGLHDVLIKNDYFKSDPSLYYAGYGYITDCTLQYGCAFPFDGFTFAPTAGIGFNFGDLNGFLVQLYVPVSLSLFLEQTAQINLRIWGQVQNYFFNTGIWFYSVGGKMAVVIEIKQGRWGWYSELIGGGGSGQILVGLRLGAAFYL